MAERINQHLNPVVGTNIRRLRKERGLNNPTVDMLIALTGIFKCDFNESFRQ